MQLWTDYEGVTLDGVFPLRKLLMPEGRSAFFSTASAKGEPTVVRLIECHFDEEEILARWRCVEALNHPNFLRFERIGQTELDGRPVVYAVFEKVDANLAAVLEQGQLTVEDEAQLASSLVSALEVLHTNGFVHEHLEPRNIFAIGGVVKLRGDCIREAPEGKEGIAAKQRDVHDLATVLLQGLTQRKSMEGVSDSVMPPPFGRIIRNGLDGTWGLDSIRAALESQFGVKPVAAPAAAKVASETPAVAASATPAAAEAKAPSAAAAKAAVRPEAQLPLPLPVRGQDVRGHDQSTGFARATARKDSGDDDQSFALRYRWPVIGMVALLLLLSIWVFAHIWGAHKATQAGADAQPASVARAGSDARTGLHGGAATQSTKQILARPAPERVPAAEAAGGGLPAAAGSRGDWRVITFTYNRRTDAEKKVSDLARTHPELRPVVFTPTGHAPYLVSIGGLMDRQTAHALARRSRSLGLPHDMYAQNYSR
jgi:hypothetical protein